MVKAQLMLRSVFTMRHSVDDGFTDGFFGIFQDVTSIQALHQSAFADARHQVVEGAFDHLRDGAFKLAIVPGNALTVSSFLSYFALPFLLSILNCAVQPFVMYFSQTKNFLRLCQIRFVGGASCE